MGISFGYCVKIFGVSQEVSPQCKEKNLPFLTALLKQFLVFLNPTSRHLSNLI